MAIEEGIDLFAITDHDTLDGWQAVRHQPLPEAMRLICGLEFSTQWRGMGIHVLGLNLNGDDDTLQSHLLEQGLVRKERASLIDQRLAKQGINGVLEGALAINGGRENNLGRVHMAQYMVAQGYVDTVPKAFDRWLGNGKVGDVKQIWPEIETVVAWIRASGGIPTLAHPSKYKLTTTKLKALFEHFSQAGGLAVEIFSSGMTVQQSQFMAKLASEYGLAVSGGSDFHDPGLSWCHLGRLPPIPETSKAVWELF
jgi:hypothetical protein